MNLRDMTSMDPSQVPAEVAPVTRGADHYVAEVLTDTISVDEVRVGEKRSNLWLDAWRDLRRRPLFWLSLLVVLVILLMALFPSMFTSIAPNNGCELSNSNKGPTGEHWLGFTRQGCDIWARIVFGAQTSLSVGLLATLIGSVIGLIFGAFAGFYGGWLDSILSRVGDIFFAIPYILAAIVVMSVLSQHRNPFIMALAIGGFAWASTARVVRAEVIRVRQHDALARDPERHRTADRGDHDQPGQRHRRRGHAVVPGLGPRIGDHELGPGHQPGAGEHQGGADGADLPVHCADGDGARIHHAR